MAVASRDRILDKLDGYLARQDFAAAERHLTFWLAEATAARDTATEMLVRSELVGLYRKLDRREDALSAVSATLERVGALGLADTVGGATAYLNCATAYKAFGDPEASLPLFLRAREVYERDLPAGDARLGGLYNNMALTLVDLNRFSEAAALYLRAVAVMEAVPRGGLEVAITYLNMASAAEAERGLLDAEEEILSLLDRARALLDADEGGDGYYAFVCEKCASVFGYYGRFAYAEELRARAGRIYEGT